MTVPASTPVEAVSTIYLFYARYVFGKMEPVMCSYISFDSRAWIVCIIFCLSRNLWTFLWQCDCVLQTYVEIICLPNKYYTRSIANICLKVLLSFIWKDTESTITFSQNLAFCFASGILLLWKSSSSQTIVFILIKITIILTVHNPWTQRHSLRAWALICNNIEVINRLMAHEGHGDSGHVTFKEWKMRPAVFISDDGPWFGQIIIL